jgi:hypothetical protein
LKTNGVHSRVLKYVRKKAPLWYKKLGDPKKKELLDMVSAPDFVWRRDQIAAVQLKFPGCRSHTTALSEFFTFFNALNEQKNKGRVRHDAVMPDLDPDHPPELEHADDKASDFFHYPSFMPLGMCASFRLFY